MMPSHLFNTPTTDPNLLFTKIACAQYTARVLTATNRLDHHNLQWLFWLVGDGLGSQESLLNLFLSDEEQRRLQPEIKRSWDHPEELSRVVYSVIDRNETKLLRNITLKVAGYLGHSVNKASDASTSPLARHLQDTKQLFGLTQDEMDLAFLFSAMQWWETVIHFFDFQLECDKPSERHTLMRVLDFTPARMSAVLSGKLFKIGIMSSDRELSIDNDFLPYFVDPDQAVTQQDLFREASAPTVALDSLGLEEVETDYLKALFHAKDDSPLHVLVYGPPGTGKSSLCKALVSELNLKGFEVLGTSGNLHNNRRAAIAACLEMTAGRGDSIMIIDEADDLLNGPGSWFDRRDNLEKAWLNEMLEKKGLRCIWVVNSYERTDDAVLRRFTYSLEMKPLGWKKRGAMLEAVLRRNGIKRHFSQECILELAREFELAPAVFDTAAKAAARLQGGTGICRKAFRKALVAKAKLFGVPVVNRVKDLAHGFLKEGINPNTELDDLESMVKAFDGRMVAGFKPQDPNRLSLLFYGPPGCGKSITARYLADGVGRPVISFKASDWLGMYVGETERNIAKAFAQVTAEEAIMVVDEIDTFLGVRKNNSRRWEVSQVNELLVQIENHTGIIICTTNRLESIDGAALRRFLLKVGFDYLRGEQVLDLYEKVLEPLGKGRLSAGEICLLENASGVTAADLFLVRENVLLLGGGKPGHGKMIGDLRGEVDLKRDAVLGQVIGF